MSWAGLIAGVVKLLAAFAEWWRDRQLIDGGKAEQKAADQGAAEAAAKRLATAAAGPKGRDVTQKELDDGTF